MINIKQLLFVFLIIQTVFGHGRMIQPTTRVKHRGYENDPIGFSNQEGYNKPEWVCRHAARSEPQEVLVAGEELTVWTQITADHNGDCDFYISYDVDASREKMTWFKIANHYQCAATLEGKLKETVKLPTWLKNGLAVLRWGWYAVHNHPNIEFFSQCSDVVIVGGQAQLPAELVRYPLINPPIFGTVYPNRWNGPSKQPWITGPACALDFKENQCEKTASNTEGHIAIPAGSRVMGDVAGSIFADESAVKKLFTDEGADQAVNNNVKVEEVNNNDAGQVNNNDAGQVNNNNQEAPVEENNHVAKDIPSNAGPSCGDDCGHYTASSEYYASKDIVYYSGQWYYAKWWVNTAPGSDNSAWRCTFPPLKYMPAEGGKFCGYKIPAINVAFDSKLGMVRGPGCGKTCGNFDMNSPNYTGGDVVFFNGCKWQAGWWTQAIAGTDSSWKKIECPVVQQENRLIENASAEKEEAPAVKEADVKVVEKSGCDKCSAPHNCFVSTWADQCFQSSSEATCKGVSGAKWCGVANVVKEEEAAVVKKEEEVVVVQQNGAEGDFVKGECVPKEVLSCINNKSTYWPKCDPDNQAKKADVSNQENKEWGHYCTKDWATSLNEMLSSPKVAQCNDVESIKKLIAQVAYETGYFSTVSQPLDGGAGLIHMIPANWEINAKDMDIIWETGTKYQDLVKDLGKEFFKNTAYGWKSVAAWYLRTNSVIGGCGENLFDASYERQTQCIFGGPVNRDQIFKFTEECWNEFGYGASSPQPASIPREGDTTPYDPVSAGCKTCSGADNCYKEGWAAPCFPATSKSTCVDGFQALWCGN